GAVRRRPRQRRWADAVEPACADRALRQRRQRGAGRLPRTGCHRDAVHHPRGVPAGRRLRGHRPRHPRGGLAAPGQRLEAGPPGAHLHPRGRAGGPARGVRDHARRRLAWAHTGHLVTRLATQRRAATIDASRNGATMARILIVDDSPSQLMGIRRIVEKLGHEALTAEDGAEGVEITRRELPDLVLMDVVMPNLNGFQATRSICRDEATRHIPVVLVTTKDQDTDRVWGMRQGARAYITKPFNEADLGEVISQLLPG